METLATLLVAIVLLLLAAAIGFSYLGGATQLLRRSGASRVVRSRISCIESSDGYVTLSLKKCVCFHGSIPA